VVWAPGEARRQPPGLPYYGSTVAWADGRGRRGRYAGTALQLATGARAPENQQEEDQAHRWRGLRAAAFMTLPRPTLVLNGHPSTVGDSESRAADRHRRKHRRTCRGQAQVLQNRSYSSRLVHVRQHSPSTSTPHAGEHVEVERPLQQLGPVSSRRFLLQRLLAGRCLGRHARFLLSRSGEPAVCPLKTAACAAWNPRRLSHISFGPRLSP
jgi:hypothetical protein